MRAAAARPQDCTGTTVSPTKFKECEDQLKAGSLSGCSVGCSPTLGMLRTSEASVVSLSEGRFGTATGLTVATTAARPDCAADFGSFATTAHGQCTPPAETVYPDAAQYPAAANPLCSAGSGTSASTRAPGTNSSPYCANASSSRTHPNAGSSCCANFSDARRAGAGDACRGPGSSGTGCGPVGRR